MSSKKYTIGSSSMMIIVAAFVAIGLLLLIASFAATGVVNLEAELAAGGSRVNDATASKGSYVQFGTNTSGAQAHLNLILNQSTRNKKFIASMPSIEGEGFWKNGYDETVVPEEQLKVSDFIGPASEHYVSGTAQGGVQGIFRTECEFSHFSYDDPIVYPGQPGKAHLHMYFGNTHANAYSTGESLRATGGGTCNGGPLNRTSYWVPAVIDQAGRARTPSWIVIYYKSLAGAGRQKIEPYPKGLKIISGNANATAEQTKRVPHYNLVGFNGCGLNADGPGGAGVGLMPKNCGSSGNFDMIVRFPFCWDGKNLDSSNHNSHMSFPISARGEDWFGNNCPTSHPVMLPSIEYRIQFTYESGDDVSKWFLASDVQRDGNGGYKMAPAGNGSTLHGDWYSGWNLDINQRWVDGCNNDKRPINGDCGTGKLSFQGPDGLKRLRPLPGSYNQNQGLGRYDDPKMEPRELIKMCPGKQLTSDIKSVALCE